MTAGKVVGLLRSKNNLRRVLLSGEGSSKLADELARNILCVGTKEETCQCNSCKLFLVETHPDSLRLKRDKSIKKEDVLVFENRILEPAILSAKKVFVINEADKMTTEAQNSFLKTLEDSDESNVFILETSKADKLLETIRSRVSIYRLPKCYTHFQKVQCMKVIVF